MTRKFFSINVFLLVVVMIFSFSACNDASSSKSTVSESTASEFTASESTVSESTVSQYSWEQIISLYCSGSWDGNSYLQGYHIKDGYLFDHDTQCNVIPDMGPYENEGFIYDVIGVNEKGTLILDQRNKSIEFWKKGFRIDRYKFDEFYSQIYLKENFILIRSGSEVRLLNFEFIQIGQVNNVVDLYFDDTLYYISDMKHNNYAITEDGNITTLPSHCIHFQGKQSKNIHEEGPNCCIIGDGPTYFIDDNMQLLEYNISGDEEIIAKLPKGIGAEFVWVDYSNSQMVVSIYNEDGHSYKLCIVREKGSVETISENALDFYVAYSTLYFMEGDTIYSLKWKDSSSPEVFFEGAYAVSPCADEAQGALVPYDQANWEGYGFTNIFSPYGEKR